MVAVGTNAHGGMHFPHGAAFDLDNAAAYRRWRDAKLDGYPTRADQCLVEIADLSRLTPAEHAELVRVCAKTNSVIYAGGGPGDKGMALALGRQLGLQHLDGNLCADEDSISALQVMPGGSRHEGYIPYTDKPINWHTDGYYNEPGERIRGMLLHCVCDAASGGENALLDHEVAYILMRDENPDYVAALMQPDVMTIPPNVEDGIEIRPARSGPVFMVEPDTGNLYMRYTARKRNIQWKEDPTTQAAVAFLERLFEAGSPYVFHHRLQPGQGIISNNALHNRTGFRDDAAAGKQRLIYRGRYYDRVSGTDFCQIYGE